ncbi:TIGR03089 family protein [Mariniluteicoccus endophyticus]
MTQLPDLLDTRVRIDPSAPFLTCYASATERTELSARTFANWVAKTGNLLVDDADLSPGDRVRLELLATRPGHWMTLVWVMAAWRAGVVVTDGDADLVVTGPAADGGQGSYACSLHPLGLGLRDLPAGVTDFSSEALAQPDAWLGTGAADADVAWDVAGHTLTHGDLARVAGRATRALVVATDAYTTVQQALAAPLVGGGSTVVVTADIADADRERIAQEEL